MVKMKKRAEEMVLFLSFFFCGDDEL